MSENITHTAVLDDVFRLMTVDDAVSVAFEEVARTQRDAARLGAITRKGDNHTVQLLTQFRARWDERTPDERLEPKLAFVLGWLCHRAVDRQMKPLFRQLEPPGPNRKSPTDTSVYHDAFCFQEIFQGGKEGPYHPAMWGDRLESLPASQKLDVAGLEEIIHVLVQRALVELHTLIPEENDIEAWMEGLFAARQEFRVDRHRYAKAIADPDPAIVKRAITDANFYDRQDPLIRAARTIQRGGMVESDAIDAAMNEDEATAEGRSHYEKVLRLALDYVRTTSTFFTSDMKPETLRERLDVGKKGRDGLYV